MTDRIDSLDENYVAKTLADLQAAMLEIKTKQSLNAESYVQMTPQWNGSWTALSTYQFITGSFATINFDDWSNYNWYYEVIGFTDAGTAFYQLYNTTDSEAVADSEVSTTITGQSNAVQLRSTKLNKYSGIKNFRSRVKCVGGNGTTELANCVMARMVFKIETQ